MNKIVSSSDLVPISGNEWMAMVIRQFHKVIEPIYGDQTYALAKIAEATDRGCEILVANQMPVGIIVYKKEPSDEFENIGIVNSFEIKSLFVVDEKVNSGKGYATQLLRRIEQQAFNALAAGVHVTISEEVPQSIKFFNKYNYNIIHEWNGRYKNGIKEFLLYKELQKDSD